MINYLPLWNSIVALVYAVVTGEILLKARPGIFESAFMTLYSISAIATSWISFGYSLLLLVPLLTYGGLASSEETGLELLRKRIKMLEGKL